MDKNLPGGQNIIAQNQIPVVFVIVVVNILLVTTTKYFVVATIFFVSTTISDQSLPANPSELSVRKITDLWQKHHSCLINEQPFKEKGLFVFPRTNSPFFRNTKPFFVRSLFEMEEL